MQADVLYRRPDNAETTGLGREGVNLIGTLPHIAEETFDGIGGLNVSMHRLRKGKEGQGVLFVLGQTSHGLGIALAVLGGSRWSTELPLPAWSVGSRCRRVRPVPRLILAWQWRRGHCAAYALNSVDEAWPQTVPRPQPAVHRDRH